MVDRVLAEFDRLSEAPNAVPRLRRFILDLAVRGRLSRGRVDDDDPLLAIGGEQSGPWPIPGHWQFMSLRALAGDSGVFTDGDWVESKDQDPSGDVRLTQLADVGVGVFRDRSDRYMRSDVAARLNCTFLQQSDVLIGRMPDPIGRACLYPGGEMPAVTVVDVSILRPGPGINPTFVMHVLNSPAFAALVNNHISGTTRQRISRGNLGRLTIPVPPVAEQDRIVAKVDEVMALCDELEAALTGRELRRSRLTAALLERLTSGEASQRKEATRLYFSNGDRLITSPAHVDAVRSALRTIAIRGELLERDERAWTETTLGSVGKWGSGGTPSRSRPDYFGGDIPWIVIGDLNDSVVTTTAETITERGLASSSAKLIDPGALLIAMYGASVGKLGTAGMRCATNQAIAHCIPDPEVIQADYLFLVLRGLRSALVERGRGGAQPNISQAILKSWPVLIPPLDQQPRIAAKVSELMRVCDGLEERLTAVRTGRSRLLEAVLHAALADAGADSERALATPA